MSLRSSTSKVDLIKIDVEGAELEVLKGALETLQRYRPMVVEVLGARKMLKH